jgi:hypothetical protein
MSKLAEENDLFYNYGQFSNPFFTGLYFSNGALDSVMALVFRKMHPPSQRLRRAGANQFKIRISAAEL